MAMTGMSWVKSVATALLPLFFGGLSMAGLRTRGGQGVWRSTATCDRGSEMVACCAIGPEDNCEPTRGPRWCCAEASWSSLHRCCEVIGFCQGDTGRLKITGKDS